MLQLDGSRRTRRPVLNFVSKNRRAVRDGRAKPQTTTEKPHLPANKPPPPKQQPSKARVSSGSGRKAAGGDGGIKDNTVVISKSYLDQLLLKNLSEDHGRGAEPINHQPTNLHAILPQTPPTCNTGPSLHPDQPNTRKQKTRVASPEGYFPFGRPGCGAPLRSDSGQVIADLRQRQRLHAEGKPPLEVPPPTCRPAVTYDPRPAPSAPQAMTLEGEVNISTDMGSPRYARGAGPYVDKYVLKEKEEKRKKQLEHVEFLKAQIASKERAKREEREGKEREEREEEAKLARERERLQREYEREAERAKRKEEESRQRQALIQQAIDAASQQALIARQQAKAQHQSPQRHRAQAPPTMAPSHSTFSPAYSGSRPTVTFDLRTTHTLDNNNEVILSDKFQAIRSPSMLQLQDHTPSSTSSQRRRERLSGELDVDNMRQSRSDMAKGSFGPGGRSYRQGEGRSHRQGEGRSQGGTRGSRIPVRSKVGDKDQRAGQTDASTPAHRATKKQSRTIQQSHNQRSPHLQRATLDRNTSPPVTSHVRPPSPPVPTLAKRLRQQGESHSQTKKLPSLIIPPSPPTKAPVQMGVARQKSPPVPALARKLKRGVPTEPTSAAAIPQGDSHTLPAVHPPRSPPVPALRTKERKGVVSGANHTHLPPIIEKAGKPHPPTNHVILQELAELRMGLLSHRSTIDHKLSRLLHNQG